MIFPVGNRKVEFEILTENHCNTGLEYFYEPEVVNVIAKVVRPGDLVIDGGANFGFFTMMLSRLVGPDGLVLAFEPDPKIYGELSENIDGNNLSNVRRFQMALWNEDGEKEFWVAPQSGYSSFFRYVPSERKVVQARKLDTLIGDWPVPRFIKLDCEGAEPWILYGAEETLRKGVDCVVVELNYSLMEQFGIPNEMVRTFMTSLGYDMFVISVKDAETGRYKLIHVEREMPLIVDCVDKDRARAFNVMFCRKAAVARTDAS